MTRRNCVLLLATACALTAQPVSVREEAIRIPTYEFGAPDPSPLFYDGRAYQGAKGPVYPYPILDKLGDVRVEKSYQAVYLENRYVRICILPELGGRIFEAVDKTNNYDFFYRQHVIKPALIGMLGAWISGGVEWNVPHHHRASSFLPVSHRVEEHPDGSRTVWLGETELRHRMRWIVGLTLHPDKSYLEATVKVFNRTPVPNTLLYFANVAVHANEQYQVIFPPSTRVATQHSKVEFSHWPVSSEVYGGVDFTQGVDVSWWKNHPKPTSMFAFDSKEDFLAGYDHGRQAGTLHIADHATVPGKKFFAWGAGAEGRMWDKILTDSDGPYLELMVGAWSDNQPDYSWVEPYEAKVVRQLWYPFQRIGGVKNANEDAAVNLEVKGATARIGFVTTAEHPAARVLLEANGAVLLDDIVAIDPAKPFVKEVRLPASVGETELRAALSVRGRELVAYRPIRSENSPLPKPVNPPSAPAQVKTNEELYLAGLRLQQFHSPASEPDPYFEEAIRRDAGDYRANTALGALDYRRGSFTKAEQRLRAAVERATKNYTSPKDGEALYYLGLVEKALGKGEAAYESLYKATWSHAWHAPAFYQLAELAARKGAFERAVEFANRSLSTNTQNGAALVVKAALLRKLGRDGEAETAAVAALALDPLDYRAARELRLARRAPPGAVEIRDSFTDGVQQHLEMAVDYANAGLWDDGVAALTELVQAYRDRSRVYPMAYYWLGYLNEKLDRPADAAENYRLAAAAAPAYCFPFRLESIAVLQRAMERNPADTRAPYYLGNLLYDLQPAEAIRLWEKSRSLDGEFALVHRNLGWAYARQERSYPKAISSYEAAIARQRDPRWLFELDQIAEFAGRSVAERLAFLEKHHDAVIERDDTLSREIGLHVEAGNYDRALELLSNRHFHVWEGGGRFSVHDWYVDAHLLRGQGQLAARRYPEALKDFEAALEYPENLSIGRPYGPGRSPQIYYHIGTALEALGQPEKARAAYKQSAAGPRSASRRRPSDDAPDMIYSQGRAAEKLARFDDAAGFFTTLVKSGRDMLARQETDFFAKFADRQPPEFRIAQAHYTAALGYLGLGKRDEARAELEQALKRNPNHAKSRMRLGELR